METRQDGYMNAVIGHGLKNKDPSASYIFAPGPLLTDQMLSNLFIHNALARKIINLPADEVVKNWINVEGDEEGCFATQALDDLGAEEKFADGVRWSRLFGGSVILMLADDGGTLEDELRENNLQSIEQLRVYDRTQVWWNDAVLYDDPSNTKYGEPQYYQINPLGGTPFMVHESRLLLFKGDPLPEFYRMKYQGWGLPVLQGMFDELRNNGLSYELAVKIMERMSQAILKLDGLLETLNREGGEEEVKKRLQMIDMARNILNTIAIDKEDEFDLKNMTLAQIPDIIDRFGLMLSAVCNIPFTLLFGRSPAGLNATGQSDMENWYSFVGQIQKRHVKKNIDRLVRLIMMCKQGLFKGKQPDKWSIKFNPLWVPSDKERAETDNQESTAQLQKSQAMQIKKQNGVISSRQWALEEGYTDEDIARMEKEKQSETDTNTADLIGHTFSKPTGESDMM